MKKFRYYNISRYRKLRYSTNNFHKNPFIVFLPGFMSDIEGKKPNSFRSFANKNQIGFLAIEYSGHGKSSGKFIEGNISLWTFAVYRVSLVMTFSEGQLLLASVSCARHSSCKIASCIAWRLLIVIFYHGLTNPMD